MPVGKLNNPDIGAVGAANGSRGGRPLGSRNKLQSEARSFAQAVLSDEAYRANVLYRARTGTLGPFEATLWAYAIGRPPASLTVHVEHGPEEDLSTCSNEELASRARRLADACASLPSSPARAALPVIDVAAQSEVLRTEPEPEPQSMEDARREELVRLLAEQAGLEQGEAAGEQG